MLYFEVKWCISANASHLRGVDVEQRKSASGSLFVVEENPNLQKKLEQRNPRLSSGKKQRSKSYKLSRIYIGNDAMFEATERGRLFWLLHDRLSVHPSVAVLSSLLSREFSARLLIVLLYFFFIFINMFILVDGIDEAYRIIEASNELKIEGTGPNLLQTKSTKHASVSVVDEAGKPLKFAEGSKIRTDVKEPRNGRHNGPRLARSRFSIAMSSARRTVVSTPGTEERVAALPQRSPKDSSTKRSLDEELSSNGFCYNSCFKVGLITELPRVAL
ncbi:unnamed protein product [Caenorhabditis auriculariae]|uniref:Uncharacterized protein n=1 Tax=Caenorhabditis auriculariae TaxID=2777116 RepID=A0A8S1HV43_9PELO|nr:unnamed protein product [Caenorhabditis auriculariae]